MLSSPFLQIISAVVGLGTGALIAFAAPRLVAYRLSEPPPNPDRRVLVPLLGAAGMPGGAMRALALEGCVAAAFVALSLHFGGHRPLLLADLYTTILLAIAYVDLQHRLVLNRLSYSGVAVALAGSFLWPGITLASAVLGAVTGLVMFGVLQVVGRGALGTGDTKLAILIGAMRGFPTVVNALLFGVILGGLAALFFLSVMRRGRKEYLAYAPYLAAGGILSFFVASP